MFTTHEILLCLSLKYKGNWDEIYQAIRNKKRITEEEGRELLASYKSDAKVVVITDPDYPEALKKIYRPPFVLFYYGDFFPSKTKNTAFPILEAGILPPMEKRWRKKSPRD